MRIKSIEVSLLKGEVTKPYISALAPEGMKTFESVLLRVTTDEGLVGLGETNPHPGFTAESPESVMQVLHNRVGPAVLGMDPTQIGALHARMDAAAPGNPFAKAPLDIAAYDLWGQALRVPVHQLLGGRLRDRVPMIWPIGGATPAENVEEVQEKLEEGYRSFHIKIGALGPQIDIARMRAIREAVGPDIPLMLDANQGWDRSTALQTIRHIEEFSPSMVEQPVPAWDIESMVAIQAAVSVPISADEMVDSAHKAMELVCRDAARVFSLKTGKMGGFMRTLQIAAIAEAAGIHCFINSMIEMGVSVAASLHVAAVVPNLVDHGHALMSNLRITEDIVTPASFSYEGKIILVPDQCHGLGIILDEDIVRRRTIKRFVIN